MKIITQTADLQNFCTDLKKHAFITIDTEFIREKTYYPDLCLIQIASEDDEAIIDPLAPDIDLAPLFEILAHQKILKVIHGGRQDVEIFYQMTGQIPTPLFDTQIAGMALGLGDQIGYENLIRKTLHIQIDKGSRFTNWAQRPLTDKQLDYAMSDVTHLRDAYKIIAQELRDLNREHWIAEEMAILTAPETYNVIPEDAWKRVKISTRKPRVFAVLKEVAAWRETLAKTDNIPRTRLLKDNTITQIALHPPKSVGDLKKMRNIHGSFFDKSRSAGLIEAVGRGLDMPKDQCPVPQKKKRSSGMTGPIVEMLRVLLRIKCEDDRVAPKLLGSASDLEQIAEHGKDADVPAMSGWRFDLFGKAALKLRDGTCGLVIEGQKITIKDIS